jgi:hypothetical protein
VSELRLASTTGRALDGTTYHLPHDLPGERTLVVLAFRQRQQACVDRWIVLASDLGAAPTPLGASRPLPAAVVEVPVLGRRYLPARRFIDGGMAAGIGDPRVLARTITVYTDADAYRRRCGLGRGDDVRALVVDHDGTVWFHAVGEPDPEHEPDLASAMAL